MASGGKSINGLDMHLLVAAIKLLGVTDKVRQLQIRNKTLHCERVSNSAPSSAHSDTTWS